MLAGKSSLASLTSLVRRSDVVFVVTDVNSHNAVLHARKVARRHHRAVRLVRRLGFAEFSAYLGAQVVESAA